MANDQEAAFEKVLTANLGRATDWVKYGDAKNGVLLAFASAWLAGIGSLLLSAQERQMPGSIAALLFAAELLFLLGALQAISALLPMTDPREFIRRPRRTFASLFFGRPRTTPRPSLLFFGDIRQMEPDTLKIEITQRYRPESDRVLTDDYIADVCGQTVITSRIAQHKFDAFNRAVLFIFIALVLLMFAFLIALLRALS